ncbi:MAG: Gfo/Idh/MocA family oxidoreductase [Bryobacteraceae bacterium]
MLTGRPAYNTLVKVGIVGLGFMGSTHLEAYSRIEDVQVAAVCTHNERALSGDLSQVGGNIDRTTGVPDFSAARKYAHWRELVVDPELDAVDICLPTDLHASVAITAMAAGRHVLCEKPMAVVADDCDRMLAAAEQYNRILMVGQVLRFWPEYRYLESFIKSGEHGAVLSATFVRSCGLPDWSRWLPTEARSGGAVLDLLIHDIDQALILFGMPERVAAKKLGSVDALTATLIYPNGPEVRVQGGWFLPGAPLSMSFQIRSERAQVELTSGALMLSDQFGQRNKIKIPETDAYQAEVAYFVDCCRNGQKPLQCMPQDSARAVKVALLLKQSRAMDGEQIKCSV